MVSANCAFGTDELRLIKIDLCESWYDLQIAKLILEKRFPPSCVELHRSYYTVDSGNKDYVSRSMRRAGRYEWIADTRNETEAF